MKTRTPARLLTLTVMVAIVASSTLLGAFSGGSTASAEPSRTAGSILPPVIHRPAGLVRSTSVPLVLALHGKGGTPAGMQGGTGFDKIADREGFVVAYLGLAAPAVGDSTNTNYISSLIKQLITDQNIDPSRVYIAGFSLGGYTTFRSGCDLSAQLAAIAVVSSAIAPLSRLPCKPTRPVSELNIAGSNDVFPIHATPAYPISADQTAAAWRLLNGCSTAAKTTQVGPTDQTTWDQCNDGASVAEYVVNGGSHIWPGSPGTTGADASYNASQAIWDFFSQHRAASATRADAKLVSVRVSGGTSRQVRMSIDVGEAWVQLQATITVGARVVVAKKAKLDRGSGVPVVLQLPRQTRAGRGAVKLAFTDSYGRRLIVSRAIRVPSLTK